MEAVSIVEYIKGKYPKIMYTPVKFSDKKALAFIMTGSQIIIGYIDGTGVLCKLVEPIDIAKLTHGSIFDAVKKIPLVDGFTEKDRERLVDIFNVKADNISMDEHRKIVEQIKSQIASDMDAKYKMMIDSSTNESVLIKKEYEDKLQKLQGNFDKISLEMDQCKKQLLEGNGEIMKSIEEYKKKLSDAAAEKKLAVDELQSMYNKTKAEKEELNAKLAALVAAEEEKAKRMSDNVSEYDSKLVEKNLEIESLKKTIGEINEKLSASEIKNKLLEPMRENCVSKLLNEKNQIIAKIKEYNKAWEDWAVKVKGGISEEREKLLADMKVIYAGVSKILQTANVGKGDQTKLKQNADDIVNELNKTIADQLAQLNSQQEKITALTASASVGASCEMEKEKITALQKELEDVRKLISTNNATKIEDSIDYDNCHQTLMNFYALNNIFYRKQEIINKLDNIISNNIGYFSNLEDSAKAEIADTFRKVRFEINKHIEFLDLKKYVDSPNMQFLKSKATRSKVPGDFCLNLGNILEYWNENKALYREQDRILTNIYEDLSGAVRVYIRIKPLIGIEQKAKTVAIHTIENKKQKSVMLDCTGVGAAKHKTKEVFGEFFGIFGETFSNIDVYTGIENTSSAEGVLEVNIDEINESSESVNPGLWSTFKQVEDGYSIVLFGYGLSGSGKTFTLVGSKGMPGLVHYGLANLKGVEKIKLKYLFEQYFSAVDVNFGKVRGKIHNLIREVPQMRKFSKDETDPFGKRIPSTIDVNNLKVNDLYALTDIIDTYRVEMGRIKKTPNNPVSSRSHLYFVFEITFSSGKTGYVTIVDTAGRESPLDIYNTFIDTTKTKLGSIMSPAGGEKLIAKTQRENLDKVYTPQHIFEVLKEGIFINETINHLTYFFNKKNYRETKALLQSTDPEKYAVNRYYVKPDAEEKGVNESNNCLMIPILDFLDSLTKKGDKGFKPTKFVMMCMVRQEEKYCDQIYETLEFATGVKSS